jgi:hypothetical protein
MPTKKDLKRAADDLEDALNESPIRKKKSKTGLAAPKVAVPKKIDPPVVADDADPEFMEKFEPETALRLTRAAIAVNYAVDKINFYADLLNTFNNEADDNAIAAAARINGKIEKWGAHHVKVQKTMDVLLAAAPKKKDGASLSAQAATGFLSSSGKLSHCPFLVRGTFPSSFPSSHSYFTLFGAYAYASFFLRILLVHHILFLGLFATLWTPSYRTTVLRLFAAPPPFLVRLGRLALLVISSDEDSDDGETMERITAVLSESEGEGGEMVMVKVEGEEHPPKRKLPKRKSALKK